MSNYKCADCAAPMQVDEWALKRGAPMTCGRCIPNLRAENVRLREALVDLFRWGVTHDVNDTAPWERARRALATTKPGEGQS